MRRLGLAAVAVMFLASACQRAAVPGNAAEPESGLHSLDQVDTRPKLKICAEPNPPAAATPRIRVQMFFVLGADGRPEPESISPVTRSGYRVPTESEMSEARERLTLCQWDPALKDGKPVRVRMSYTIYVLYP